MIFLCDVRQSLYACAELEKLTADVCSYNYDTRPQRYEQRAERERREAVAEAQTEAAKKFSRERLELFEKVRYSVIV